MSWRTEVDKSGLPTGCRTRLERRDDYEDGSVVWRLDCAGKKGKRRRSSEDGWARIGGRATYNSKEEAWAVAADFEAWTQGRHRYVGGGQ